MTPTAPTLVYLLAEGFIVAVAEALVPRTNLCRDLFIFADAVITELALLMGTRE